MNRSISIKFLCILLCLGSGSLIGENPCGIMLPKERDANWGTGAVYLPSSKKLRVYDQNEVFQGWLIKKKNHHVFRTQTPGGQLTITALLNTEISIGNENYTLLKAQESFANDAYFEIKWKVDEYSIMEFLIKKTALFEAAGDFCFYDEFLLGTNIPEEIKVGKSEANIGVNIEQNCLNLRASNSAKSEKILCIASNDFGGISHMEILELDKQWAKVKVSVCNPKDVLKVSGEDGDGCACKVKEKRYTGWVKAIDETGFPNIWFSSSAY